MDESGYYLSILLNIYREENNLVVNIFTFNGLNNNNFIISVSSSVAQESN